MSCVTSQDSGGLTLLVSVRKITYNYSGALIALSMSLSPSGLEHKVHVQVLLLRCVLCLIPATEYMTFALKKC